MKKTEDWRIKNEAKVGPDLVATAGRAGLLGTEVVVLDVDGEALLDVGGEVAERALVHAAAHVVLEVAVQVPLVGRAELAQVALDHRHRMVLDVFGVARLHVRHIVALNTSEEFLLEVRQPLVALEHEPRSRAEIAGRTFQIFVVARRARLRSVRRELLAVD